MFFSVYLIPKRIADIINKIFARFLWSSCSDKQPIFWKRREIIDIPNGMGGLGIRNVRAFDMALLTRLDVRIHEKKELLVSKVFNSKYKGSPIELGLRGKKSPWCYMGV